MLRPALPLAAGGAVGGRRLRHLYDLRHTYATFALRAGVSVFAVSRLMGSSLAMIDRHYGHLAHDSRKHAVSLLDAGHRGSATDLRRSALAGVSVGQGR